MIISLALLSTVAALVAPDLANLRGLVPISADSILGAVPLMLLTYFIGLSAVLVVSRMPQRGWLFTWAFLLRIVVMLFLSVLFQVKDEITYHQAALRHAHGLWSWQPGAGYYHLNEIVYAVFGPNLLLPKTVNVLLGALLPFLAYDIGLQVFHDRRVAWRSWLWTAVLPPTVIYSTLNLKEIGTCFLFAAGLWALCHPSPSLTRFVATALCVAMIYWLRGAPWALVAGAGYAVCTALGTRSVRRTVAPWRPWARVATVAALVVVLSPIFVPPVATALRGRLNPEAAYHGQFRASSATVMRFVDRSDPLSPANATIFFLRGLYSPSPLRPLFDFGFASIVQAFNMLVWYMLFPFAVIAVASHLRRGTVLACAVMVFGVLVMATVGTPIGGDPERHRFAVAPLLFVLAASGAQTWPSIGARWVLSFWWLGAVAFNVLWFGMRA